MLGTENFSKSEILPLFQTRPPPWASDSIFPVAKTHIMYLGIKIGKAFSFLYHLNYSPVLLKIAELENWSSLPLSSFGRCHLF